MANARRGRSWISWSLGIVLAVSAGWPASGALAQGTNSITIVTTGGAAPGTYELTTDEPCQAGLGAVYDWAIDVLDSGTLPSSLYVVFSPETPEYSYLQLSFGEPESADGTYSWNYEHPGEATVDDRGASATLTLTATDLLGSGLDGSDSSGGSVVVTVECTVIERLREPPEATQPPAGTIEPAGDPNTLHVVTTGGPAPGTYDVTTNEPCRAGILRLTDWEIYVQDTGSDPSSVALTFSPEDPSSNFVSLLFGVDRTTAYDSNPAEPSEATVDDRGDSATLTLTATSMWGTAADGSDAPDGSVSVTLECNTIERIQSAPTATPTLPPPPSVAPVAAGFSGQAVIDGGPRPGTFQVAAESPCRKRMSQYGQVQWFASSSSLDGGPPPYLSLEMLVGGDAEFDLQDDIRIDVDFEDMFYRVQESSATRYRVDDGGHTATIQVVGVPAYFVRADQDQGNGEQLALTIVCSSIDGGSGLISPAP